MSNDVRKLLSAYMGGARIAFFIRLVYVLYGEPSYLCVPTKLH